MRHAPRLWCLAVVALGGCTDDREPDRPSIVAPPRATGPEALPPPPADERRTVRLVSPGAEPRQVLRYRARVGAEYIFTMDTKMAMEMASGGHRMFGNTNEGRSKIALQVTEVDAAGDVALALRVIDMSVPNFDPTQVGAVAPNLAGSRGTFVVSDRGLLVEESLPFLEAHEDARDELQLEDYVFAFPAEPVGLGATWEVSSTSLRNGMTLRVVETHELVALDGSTGRTVSKQNYDSPPQLVPALAFNALSTFELVALESTGTGEARFALDQMLPIAADSTFGMSAQMRIRQPEQISEVTMTMSLTSHAGIE